MVWEYRMENNTEYVVASGKTEVTEGSNTTHLVVTDFTFNNKQKHIGYCSPQDDGSLDQVQPVVIISKGHVEFYKENDWSDRACGVGTLALGAVHLNTSQNATIAPTI